MTPAEILRAAKAKIEDPAHWCQGGLARNADGEKVGYEDPDARAWCADGAVASVIGEYLRGHIEFKILDRASIIGGAAYLNDTTDHATVMKMFDRAIELAEAEEQ